MKNETTFSHEFHHRDAPHPFPNRFKDVASIQRKEGDGGVELVATVENGNLLLDFGKPISCLGMTESDAKAIIMMIIEGMTVAALQGSVEKDKAH